MNQRGEVTLFSCLAIVILMSLVLLCGLDLRKSFRDLEKRTHLFLCVKETKGEFNEFMKFMGRTNWGIKNINRVSIIMLFIPGLQGAATNARKAKKYLVQTQEMRLASYMKSIHDIKRKGCPLDPRMLITPFKLGERLLKRDIEGALILREEKWTYYFLSKPYLLEMNVEPNAWENIHPKLKYVTKEKAAKLSSHLFSSW